MASSRSKGSAALLYSDFGVFAHPGISGDGRQRTLCCPNTTTNFAKSNFVIRALLLAARVCLLHWLGAAKFHTKAQKTIKFKF
jgi:hypothetical protein